MSFHLTQTNKVLAVQSLQRIHHLWCDEHCEEAPIEKISMLCEALCVLAPYQCNIHLAGLWFAYRYARDQWLPKLSWVRHKLFTDELHRMIELVDPTPEESELVRVKSPQRPVGEKPPVQPGPSVSQSVSE